VTTRDSKTRRARAHRDPSRSPRRRRHLVLAGLAVAGLLAAGCGDDDTASSDTTSSNDAAAADTSTDPDAYCGAALAIETAGEPDIDFATATEEEITEAAKTFAAETLRPLADDLLAAAPPELEAHLQVQSDALDQVAETGDFSAFESPEVTAASEATHAYDLEACGWTNVAVDAADYSFAGLPDQLDAGVVSFELTNGGTEVHEMVLLRKNDGVTETFDELLALPEEEAMEKATMVGLAGPIPPGEPGYAVVDLDAGEYMAVCFIPVGTLSFDGPPPEGPPHMMQGMVHQLTVT
jgi:hypothetical protein